MEAVFVRNLTRQTVPRFPYAEAAKAVLPGWEVSLVFVGKTTAREMNTRLRAKQYVPNVLSYPVGKKNGEILICLAEANRQAPAYGMSKRLFACYLFIHGLLHLKGEAHSGTMERRERLLLARFAKSSARTRTTNVTENRHGNRHRHAPGQTGRRRRTR